MNESEGFKATNLKILIFDKVVRILYMAFKDTIDQIMRNLPKKPPNMLSLPLLASSLRTWFEWIWSSPASTYAFTISILSNPMPTISAQYVGQG